VKILKKSQSTKTRPTSRRTAARLALLLAVSLLLSLAGAGCSWTGGNVSNYEDDEDIIVPAGTYTKLIVENHAGTIRIRGGDGENVRGILRKKASGNGASILKSVVAAATYQIVAEGETLRIKEVFKTDDRVDFWNWKETNHPDVNVGLEYDLVVPAGIQSIEIYQSAGNTELTGVTGNVSIVNNAGNITMTGVSLSGDSRIALVSGNLDLSLAALDPAASLIAELTAGNVSLRLPKNTDASLGVEVAAGTISGNIDSLPVTNSAVTHTLGAGSALISIRVTSGNISVKAD